MYLLLLLPGFLYVLTAYEYSYSMAFLEPEQRGIFVLHLVSMQSAIARYTKNIIMGVPRWFTRRTKKKRKSETSQFPETVKQGNAKS